LLQKVTKEKNIQSYKSCHGGQILLIIKTISPFHCAGITILFQNSFLRQRWDLYTPDTPGLKPRAIIISGLQPSFFLPAYYQLSTFPLFIANWSLIIEFLLGIGFSPPP